MEITKFPETLVIEFFSRVWASPHDLNTIDNMMTEDYIITSAGKVIKGRENFKLWVKEFHHLLKNARTENQEVFANSNSDRVVSRWVCSGYSNGIFGLPADGRFVSFTGIAIWSIRDGKFSECWVERSAFELYQELMVAP